jgi:pimeloyl-ACP methyl ester carboxylesterase
MVKNSLLSKKYTPQCKTTHRYDEAQPTVNSDVQMNAPIENLVLLPGLDGTGKLFEPLMNSLSGHLDVQIFRYAPKETFNSSTLLQLIYSDLPTEPFVLIAESFSSLLAIEIAAKQPQGLRGLVLCAGFATSPLKGWRRKIFGLLAPSLFRFKLPTFALKHWLAGRDAPIALVASLKSALSTVAPAALASRLRYVFGSDVRAELSQISVPMLYLQATQDRLVPAFCANEILHTKPEMKIEPIAGPHLLLQREPQQATNFLMNFLSQL